MAKSQQPSLGTTFISPLSYWKNVWWKILPITWDRIQLCQRLMYSSRMGMSIHHFSLPLSFVTANISSMLRNICSFSNEEGGNSNFLGTLPSKSWSVLQPIYLQQPKLLILLFQFGSPLSSRSLCLQSFPTVLLWKPIWHLELRKLKKQGFSSEINYSLALGLLPGNLKASWYQTYLLPFLPF